MTGLAWVPLAVMIGLGVWAWVIMLRHGRRPKPDPKVSEAWRRIGER